MTIDEQLLQFFSLEKPLSSTRLAGGANNCVHRLSYPDRTLVLKQYFQHPTDLRKRLESEYAFATYAWNSGLRCIPEPLACNAAANAALYSYIDGSPVIAPSQADVEQAIDFFLTLNKEKHKSALPDASEACFSILQHRELIDRRMQRLISYEQKELASFLSRLLPKWEIIRNTLCDDPLLDPLERCISPSDFGFHNALREPSGRVVFFDFEYAGWDDPAKTVCDFFCQPRIPVPRDFFALVSRAFANSEAARERVRLLFPAYQIKWCCILLNCFSPTGQLRSDFAASNEQKKIQLEKAELLFNRLEDPWLI